jgi:hypothetical protein
VWFRPGAHEVASWIVTGVELMVSILNMMLAFEIASGQKLSSVMQAWYFMAPVSPIFSMVGAIILIMTSTELRKRHRDLELQEQKDSSNREFELAMHHAEMEVKHQYLGFIKTKLTTELNAPERHLEMQDHAAMLVSDVLSGLSGIQSVPRLSSPRVPNERTIEQGQAARLPVPPPAPRSLENTSLDEGDAWLDQVNARIEQERKQRLAQPSEETPSPVIDRRRLQKLASIAEEKGIDLARFETLLGLAVKPSDSLLERVTRLVEAASKWGYSIDDIDEKLGISSVVEQGGNDAKKK